MKKILQHNNPNTQTGAVGTSLRRLMRKGCFSGALATFVLTGSLLSMQTADAAEIGNEEACNQPLAITLGQTVNGTLNAETDCFRSPGRLVDSFSLELSEMTVFIATMTSDDFDPLMGINRGPESGLPSIGAASSTGGSANFEFVLPAGSYRPFASSLATNMETPVTGAYSFTTQIQAEPNVGCPVLSTVMTWGSVAQGNITNEDCVGDDGRHHDFYSKRLLVGEEVWATVTAGSDVTVSHSAFGNFISSSGLLSAGQSHTFHYVAEAEGYPLFIVREANAGEGGSYTLSYSNSAPVELSQYAVLQALYNATGGANWANNTGWIDGAEGTECNWFGVQCNDEGHVTHLNLNNNSLSGTLPEVIGQLSHLQHLGLNNNQIGGNIPASLGQLTQLTGLALHFNNLTGQIPSQLGQLSLLTYLDLGVNQLSGPIPIELSSLSNLIGLYLGDNQLSGSIPAELANLSNLKSLFLGVNQLTGTIPASLGGLSNLEQLNLEYNLLTGAIPAELGNLSVPPLQTLNLRNNLLSGNVPQSVLDLGVGVVNLWGNIALNIPKGDSAACVADPLSPLVIGETRHGELTPFSDCYVEEVNALVDFHVIDLSEAQGTTQLRVESFAEWFWPMVGILGDVGTEGNDVVDAQGGQPPSSFEVALAPGIYTLYIHGGFYTGEKNDNVPASGPYSITLNTLNELQSGCLDFNRTWVTKGTQINAALSSDDCLDTFNEPHRLFDSYAIWLEQGESVLVTVEAEIATQILSFNSNGFIAGSAFTAANTKHGLTVTATQSGWHRFAPYTTNNNPQETGAYTMRFMQPPVFGAPSACTQNLPAIALEGSVNGSLNNETDCFNLSRLSDRYVLNISEPTLFRASMQTDGFHPLIGLYRAGDANLVLGNRVGVSNTVTLEMYLAPGSYWLFASSRFTALDTAIEGDYTLSLTQSLPLSQMQTGGCVAGDTRLVLGAALSIEGAITAGDCPDTTTFGNDTGNPERDGYQLVLPQGSVPVQINLAAQFDARLSIWRSGQFVGAWEVDAGTNRTETLTLAGSYQINVLGQQGPNAAGGADRGDYTLSLTPQVGNEAACSVMPAITLNSSTDGTLDRTADCYQGGRLIDRYSLTLTETTLFRVSMINNAFAPFTGIYSADGSRLLGSRIAQNNVFTEYLLPAGQYQVFASSWQAGVLTPPAGNYTLLVSDALPISSIQANPQFGPTRLIPQAVINGELATTDARDTIGATAEQNRYLDGYSFAVPAGQTVTASVEATFPVLFAKWQGTNFSNLVFSQALSGAANESVSFQLEGPANYLMYVVGNEDGVTGPYTLSLVSTLDPALVRTALEALYNATGGASWTNNTNWLGAEGTHCSWYGIVCENGQIVSIELDNNNLTGSLPTELGSLVSLRTLFVGGNQLTGTLPESFAQLSNLTGIWAWGNQFSGALPSWLGSLTELRNLNLGGNNFSGSIPASLGSLVNLVELELGYNLLTGTIPAELGNLSVPPLQTLNLRNNLLSGNVPQSVLDLGVVNLWGNINLNIAKGDPAACVAGATLSVGESVSGELTPFSDCYVADENVIVDFYGLDLSEAEGTTLIRIEGSSQHFWPHMGILGGEGLDDRDISETQVGEPPYAFEAALAPGQYTLYIHGGVYNHDKNVNVPATGTYSLSISAINELQEGCLDFNNTWVTKGIQINAALSSDDCLDTFNEPHRLFDSYAIWLEQGERVTVVLEAQIATQLLSFNANNFISASPFTAANTKHGVTVTAAFSGWHRFAPYTTNSNPVETGAYTIRFMEPIVVGDPQACTQNLPVIGLGDSIQGALNAHSDCFNLNRLSDRYVLNITEPTLLRATMQTDGFMPLVGVYRAGATQLVLGNRVGIDESTTIEFYLAQGQYWLFASSRFTILDEAIEGAYTLSLSESLPISQMQTGGCVGGYTRLVLGGPLTIQGQITEQDCSSQLVAFGNPELDGFFLVMPTGSAPIQLSLTADFNSHFNIWRSGTSIVDQSLSAGESIAATLTEAGSYQITVRGQQGLNAGTADRGNYTLSLTPQLGNEAACTPTQSISLGQSVNGTLEHSDCIRNGRLSDRYLLTLTETTLFRVSQTNNQFPPFTGILNADGNRLLGSRVAGSNVFTEYLLPAGQYWVFASTAQADALNPPAGNYTLELSEALPLGNIQTNPQFGPTRLIPQGTVQGELATTDNRDTIGATLEQNRYLDGYSFAVPAGQTVTATVQAGYPLLFSKWQGTSFSALSFTEARTGAANEAISFQLEGPANYLIYVIGNEDGVTGPYTLSLVSTLDPALVRTALEALYNATGGGNWTNNTGWMGAPGTECTWFGIVCENGEITSIELDQNNLVGALPAELGNLSRLRSLFVGGNQLTGTLPESFAQLINLTGIWAWGNQLGGTLPDWLGSLSELRYLNLGGNNFSGSIPASLGSLFNLVELELGYNLLSGQVPSSLANLVNATSINLRNNLLSGDVPQSVLDLGVANLWGNINLNIAKGDPASCVNQPLTIGNQISGHLTPFTDCYVEAANALTDYYRIDLTEAQDTTLLSIEANSNAFYPHVGLLRVDGSVVMGQQIQSHELRVEVALAPGDYTLYVHGGAYNHNKDINVPASGAYTLLVDTRVELQQACAEFFNSTWVTKGAEFEGTLIPELDCVDNFNERNRRFDSYAIWLEQGEAVAVTTLADFTSALLVFNADGFIRSSANTPPDLQIGMVVTAAMSGWHRFAVYTPFGAAEPVGGNYLISFAEPVALGDSASCSVAVPIALGDSSAGAALSNDDCYIGGRYYDYYSFTLSENTLFNAVVDTSTGMGNNRSFVPLVGVISENGTPFTIGQRSALGSSVSMEMFLPAGNYRMSVSHAFMDEVAPPTGGYTLSLSSADALGVPQNGCVGDLRTLPGFVFGGVLTNNDCPAAPGSDLVADGYQFVLPAGQSVNVTLQPAVDMTLTVSRSGVAPQMVQVPAGASATLPMTVAANYRVVVSNQQVGQLGAYTLSLSVVVPESSEPTPEPAPPPAPTPTPEPTPPSGPAPVTDAEVEGDINNLNQVVDAIVVQPGAPVSVEVMDQVNTALTQSSTLAAQIASNISSGTGSVNSALTALTTISKTLEVTGTVTQSGGAVSSSNAVSSLTNVANVLTAMSSRTSEITVEQRAAVQQITSSTVNSSANLITSSASADDLISVVAATSAVINAASDAGAEISPALAAQAEQLVTKAISAGIATFSTGIDTSDPAQVENLLRTNPAAMEFAVAASVSVRSRIKPDSSAIEGELASRGLEASVSESLSNVLSAVSNPDGVTVGGTSATEALLSALVQFLTGGAQVNGIVGADGRLMFALSTNGVELKVDPLTGSVLISASGERYAAAVVNTRIVSPAMPRGVSYLRDGRALVVGNGVAIELAPVASDLVGFTAAVRREGFDIRLRDDAAVEIKVSNTQRLIGVFAYDNIAAGSGSCGQISFVEPSTPENSPEYAFGVVCANGVSQRLVPFVQSNAFYRAIAALGLSASTDRNTGIIQISGVGRFKPGFFVDTPSASEAAFWQANKDGRGVAFIGGDFNGDGITDYLFITETGVQPIYGVGP